MWRDEGCNHWLPIHEFDAWIRVVDNRADHGYWSYVVVNKCFRADGNLTLSQVKKIAEKKLIGLCGSILDIDTDYMEV